MESHVWFFFPPFPSLSASCFQLSISRLIKPLKTIIVTIYDLILLLQMMIIIRLYFPLLLPSFWSFVYITNPDTTVSKQVQVTKGKRYFSCLDQQPKKKLPFFFFFFFFFYLLDLTICLFSFLVIFFFFSSLPSVSFPFPTLPICMDENVDIDLIPLNNFACLDLACFIFTWWFLFANCTILHACKCISFFFFFFFFFLSFDSLYKYI